MRIILCQSTEELASRAADLVLEALPRHQDVQGGVLGLATGSSPEPVYQELAARHDAGAADFTGTTAFTLDEYVGLDGGHPQSYRATIRRAFTDRVGISPERLHTPRGLAEDPVAEARRYDALIRQSGGVDVQVLGIGANGHIGFNEPTSSLASRTRVKTLSSRTRADNARFFGAAEEVPRLCLTQGLGTISEARRLVLVAEGAHKAEAVRAAVEGPLSAWCPASVLQLHPQAVLLLDEGASSLLQRTEYYREAEQAQAELEARSDPEPRSRACGSPGGGHGGRPG